MAKTMLKLLQPKEIVSRLEDINLQRLKARGICALLIDLDNTVVRRDHDLFTPEAKGWLERAREMGFKICIVSNNSTRRVQNLARQVGVPFVHRAVKPLRRPFYRAMKLLGVSAAETAVIGDQLFTDVLGGNRAGLYTILVEPLPGKEFWATRLISRRLEKLVMARLWRLSK